MKNIFRKILTKFLRTVLPIEISELKKKKDEEIGGLLTNTVFPIFCAVCTIPPLGISLYFYPKTVGQWKLICLASIICCIVILVISITIYKYNYQKIKTEKKW